MWIGYFLSANVPECVQVAIIPQVIVPQLGWSDFVEHIYEARYAGYYMMRANETIGFRRVEKSLLAE